MQAALICSVAGRLWSRFAVSFFCSVSAAAHFAPGGFGALGAPGAPAAPAILLVSVRDSSPIAQFELLMFIMHNGWTVVGHNCTRHVWLLATFSIMAAQNYLKHEDTNSQL